MSKKEVTLNSKQLHELKWFCKNVVGTRNEFYEALESLAPFKEKIDRLYRTAHHIKAYLDDMSEDSDISPFKNWFDEDDSTKRPDMKVKS